MPNFNTDTKKILLANLLKSEQYSFLNQNKNNFKRIIDDLKKSQLEHIYYDFIIPLLSEQLSLSELNRNELITHNLYIKKILSAISFEYEVLTPLEVLINEYKKSPYYIQNLKQENRLKRNFCRFLKLMAKNIQREISKRNLSD